jgi:hypothetical protein
MLRCSAALGLAATLSATQAGAGTAVVAPCGTGAPDRAWMIAEPWDANTMTFANGAIRVAVLDAVEPGAAAFHLMVLSPPYDELGIRQCRILSYEAPGLGFGFLSLERAEASYDPASGLTVVMDMGRFNPDTGLNDAWALSVTINQATGLVTGAW